MTEHTSSWMLQLKEGCKAGHARWACWLARADNNWQIGPGYALSKGRQAVLLTWLQQAPVAGWLAGALSSGRVRSRELSGSALRRSDVGLLDCQRLYAYPNLKTRAILVVGADQQASSDAAVWRILAANPPPVIYPGPVFEDYLSAGLNSVQVAPSLTPLAPPVEEALRAAAAPAIPPVPPVPVALELDASYGSEGVLRRVLEYLVDIVPCDAAHLAIRFGDVFRIQAIWGCPPALQGLDLAVQADPALDQLATTRQGLILERVPALPPPITFQLPHQSWMGVPIVLGQRVIGLVAFLAGRPAAFTAADLQRAAQQIDRLAYTVENAIVFSEAARYLQQLAMLNELASAASLGVDTDEVAHRVIQRLARTFSTERVAMFLLTSDDRALRVVGGGAGFGDLGTLANTSLENSLVGYVVQTGLPVRVGETRRAPVETAPEARPSESWLASRSELAVPLKYRGKVIGALALGSVEPNAFSAQDEQLLVVIASHLAGLVENVRLNEETRERARKLADSVRQLTAVRETALDITADLELNTLLQRVTHRARELVDARGAELSLLEEKNHELRNVVSQTPWPSLPPGAVIPLMAGVAGRVAAFGEPLVIPDYNAWSGRLLPERLAPFRTVAGVPLKFAGQVLGALTVIDDRPDKTFRAEDVQLLELLAPQIAVSIRNARLYQELQARIVAQRLAENRLVVSARLAAVGEMAAGVAHELNNPLTTVTGFVELALNDLPADSPYREDLDLVLQEARRAGGVVRRLLDFSRPAESQRQPTDLNDLIDDVLALVNHLLRTRSVELETDYTAALPAILVDPNQIKQVLLNLIHNAIQAMPGGGKLSLKTALVSRDSSEYDGVAYNGSAQKSSAVAASATTKWVTVAVRDTGEGISDENRQRIFEPFFTTRPVGTGTGLGLSISYGIISDHGGFIEVESQLGQGSCFTVYLPLGEAEA